MSIITTGVSTPIGNPTPEALAKWLKNDFISMSFYDDNIIENFNLYYNSFTGEITVEYYKDRETQLEITNSTNRVVKLYNDYFYKLLLESEEKDKLYKFIKNRIDFLKNNNYEKQSDAIYKKYQNDFDADDFTFSKPFYFEREGEEIVEVYCQKINTNTYIFRFDFGKEVEGEFDYYKDYYSDFNI